MFFPQLAFASQEECTSPNSRKLAVAESPSPATQWKASLKKRVLSSSVDGSMSESGDSVTDSVAFSMVCKLGSAIKKNRKNSWAERNSEIAEVADSLSSFVDDHVDYLSPRAVAHAKKALSFVDEVSKKIKNKFYLLKIFMMIPIFMK